MDIYGYIYVITNNKNGKRYVGQTTSNFSRRYSGNLERNTSSQHLRNAIRYYGIENFSVDEEFDIAYSKDELDEKERYYIKKFRCTNRKYGYNSEEGGSHGKPNAETIKKLSESHRGYVMPESQKNAISNRLRGEQSYCYGKPKSEAVRAKISKSLKGKMSGSNNPNYGKPMSETQKAKLSKALTGRTLSDETRKKMSESRKGLVHTALHNRNISEARKGIVFSEEHKQHLREARRKYLEARASSNV